MRVVVEHQRMSPDIQKVLADYMRIRAQFEAINRMYRRKRTKGISRAEGYERGLYKMLKERGIDVPEPVLYNPY